VGDNGKPSQERECPDLSGRVVAHLCIDMQKMFAEETEWRTPWMDRVLPVIEEIAGRHAAETIFTRFIPPRTPDEAQGSWRAYFERWRNFTRERLDPELLKLLDPLGRLAPPAAVLDKPGYSPFHNTQLHQDLQARGVDTLVVTGAETDMCVAAAVLSAVERGYFVVLVKDALCSSSDDTHDALIKLYAQRFGQQIFLTTAEPLLAAWPER